MYKQLNQMKAFIGKNQIFTYIKGMPAKIIQIDKNKSYHEELVICKDCTKQDFEKGLFRNNYKDSLFFELYKLETNN